MPVAPIIMADTAQVRTFYSLAGINAYTLQYVRFTAALNQTVANSIADAFFTPWSAHVRPRFQPAASLVSIMVTDVRVSPGAQFQKVFTSPGAGTGEMLAPQLAAVITWRTGLTGRSYRGRTFLAGFNEIDAAGQSLSATLITALNNYATALRTGLNTAGYPLVVGSRLLEISTPVTSHTVRPYWRTQRRRTNPY